MISGTKPGDIMQKQWVARKRKTALMKQQAPAVIYHLKLIV